MPVKHQRTFRVRHYECDTYGHLNNVNYVRYMQETALDASAAVGWDDARYEAVGHQWLIRETSVEYLLPLTYNEEVTITTWVDDFRRVRSRRLYEFNRVSDGVLVAKGITDWVYLNTQTLRPTRIPEDMIYDFDPDWDGTLGDSRDKFPEPPPPPEAIYGLPRRVEWRDVDTIGHANNATYFDYFQDIATQIGRQYKWDMARITEAGFAMVLRKLHVEYLQPALLDDELTISTYFSNPKRAMFNRHFRAVRNSDDTLLARGVGLLVCIDIETGRPRRIPNDMMEDYRPNGVFD